MRQLVGHAVNTSPTRGNGIDVELYHLLVAAAVRLRSAAKGP